MRDNRAKCILRPCCSDLSNGVRDLAARFFAGTGAFFAVTGDGTGDVRGSLASCASTDATRPKPSPADVDSQCQRARNDSMRNSRRAQITTYTEQNVDALWRRSKLAWSRAHPNGRVRTRRRATGVLALHGSLDRSAGGFLRFRRQSACPAIFSLDDRQAPLPRLIVGRTRRRIRRLRRMKHRLHEQSSRLEHDSLCV